MTWKYCKMKRIVLLPILLIIGTFIYAQDQPLSKIDSLQNMLVGSNQTDSIKYLTSIGEEYFSTENYSSALTYFFHCLKISEATHNIRGAADATNDIGRVYYNMENYKQGLIYFIKALNYYRVLEDEAGQGGVFNNLALVYYEIDSIDFAIQYYNKALALKNKYGEKLSIATIYHNLGLVYMSQKRFEEAIQNLNSSKKIFEELGYEKYAANTTNNIGRAYYKNGKYKEALVYFRKGLKEAIALNSAFLIMDNYKYQSDCYAKMKNYSSAYHYSNRYHSMKDSLFNIAKEKQLAEIQANFENEINKQENKILKQDNESKAATIKNQYVVNAAILIITILLGVLAIIYYWANQSKTRANEYLKYQKLEIQKNNKTLSRLNAEKSKQNKEIRSQKIKLEELNNIKDKLFSIISHEFRSPLNSLKGTLTLLKSGVLSEEELDLISKELTDKINHTSIFLENLLNWAKSQMQGIQVKAENIDIFESVEENVLLLESMAEKKNVEIRNEIPAHSIVYADPNMMNLVFKNLISNAIKFSMSGEMIEIKSQIKGDFSLISVKDNGVGMSPENIKMLFRVQSFTTRGTANEKGTGLGLYITKNFIESNGGKIWVESEKGAGSTFKFTVPLRKSSMGKQRQSVISREVSSF